MVGGGGGWWWGGGGWWVVVGVVGGGWGVGKEKKFLRNSVKTASVLWVSRTKPCCHFRKKERKKGVVIGWWT